MQGRDKNFWVLMIFQLRNCKNKISLSQFFFTHPLHRCVLSWHKTDQLIGGRKYEGNRTLLGRLLHYLGCEYDFFPSIITVQIWRNMGSFINFIYKEFWASSSIVGISNASQARNNRRKLIWIVIFLCGLALYWDECPFWSS